MSDKFISLESLKEYDKQMKEAYIEPLESELSGEVTLAILKITAANTEITLQNLTGVTKIDWGDGTINNELSHTYASVGEYKCKIYDVTELGLNAFRDCDSLTSVAIPNSVTKIGAYAFADCTSLTSITIPNSVITIQNYAFEYCDNLTNVKIGNSVTTIGALAFYACYNLTSIAIPDSLTKIGTSAFWDCTSLTSIIIPDSVTTLATQAFANCSSLTIYCEVESQPATWNSNWNYSNRPVVWGYKHKDYPEVVTKVGEIDKKLDKTGGTISGIVNVEGALTLPNSPDNPETAEVTDTYVSRETANKSTTGLTVVDGAATTVKKIYGSTVASKNLITLPYSFTTYTVNGITFTAQSDGGIKVTGTATATAVRDLNKTPLFGYNLASSNGKAYTMGGFTISGGKDDVIFAIDAGSGKAYVYVESGKTVDTVIYPMFQYGTDTSAAATTYRPYFSGLKNAYFKGIRSTGKNLFDISVIENSTNVINNGDGTISVNNYPANTGKTLAQLCPNMRAGETYTLRFSTEATDSKLIYLWGIGVWYVGQKRIITEEDLNSNVGFYGYHPDNENAGKACKISDIRIGYDTTEYEPYKADESFMLDEAVELGKWDYIDTKTKKIYPRTKIITLDGSEIWTATDSASLTGTSKYSYKTSLAVAGKGLGYSSTQVIYEKRADIKEMGTTGGAVTTGWSIIEMYTNTLATVEEVEAYFTNNPLDCAYQLKTTKSDDLALPTDNYSSFDGGSETVIQGAVDNSADGAIIGVEQTYSIHENPDEAATKAYVNNGLAKKLDKTGGTITGSLIVEKGADTTLSALVVKNGSVAYGLTYDSEDEAYKLGQGTVDEKGDFSFAEGEGAPIALRDDSTAFTDRHIVIWSADGNKFIDSGIEIDDVVTVEGDQTINGNKTFTGKIVADELEVHSESATGSSVTIFDTTNGVTVKQDNNTHVARYAYSAILYSPDNLATTYRLDLPTKNGTLLVDSDLDNIVTTNTEQNITASKTFVMYDPSDPLSLVSQISIGEGRIILESFSTADAPRTTVSSNEVLVGNTSGFVKMLSDSIRFWNQSNQAEVRLKLNSSIKQSSMAVTLPASSGELALTKDVFRPFSIYSEPTTNRVITISGTAPSYISDASTLYTYLSSLDLTAVYSSSTLLFGASHSSKPKFYPVTGTYAYSSGVFPIIGLCASEGSSSNSPIFKALYLANVSGTVTLAYVDVQGSDSGIFNFI